MAIIKPFKGYCPNSEIAKYVSSPPYDVMSSDEARDMVKNNPDSFLRVIKPEIDFQINKEPNGDTLHKHGSKNLQNLINKRKIKQDSSPCFYLYSISMGDHTQTGIMAAVSIEEYNTGKIKKHEFTRPEKEDDRTNHIDIINGNTGPVFLTFKNDGEFQSTTKSYIINKPDTELIKRVYNAQKTNTSKGDWIELVKKDFELIGEQFDEVYKTKPLKVCIFKYTLVI